MISVIIPTFKNEEMFIANLEKNIVYLKDCQIIVVNDNPEKSISGIFHEKFPKIHLKENKSNLGFAGSINEGIKISKNKYILLLNSDVILTNSTFLKALKKFQEDPTLFAVTFIQKDENKFFGKNRFYWQKGMFYHERSNDLKSGKCAWAEGGSCILDRDKTKELGLFDEIYVPFYWEDIDLSYRAWKKGYNIVFDHEIEVIHRHESTIGKYFTKSHVEKIAYRNQFIFIWKNITSCRLLVSHFVRLPFYLFYFSIKGNWNFVIGLFWAIVKIPAIIRRRIGFKRAIKVSDEKVLQNFL